MAGPYAPSSEKNYLGFGKQASKGTSVAPTVFLPYMGAVDLGHGQAGSEIREAGSGLYVTRTLKERHDPAGSSNAAWRPSALAELCAWFLGADSVSGVGPYTHAMTPAEAITWVSVEQNLGDEFIERFADGIIKRFTISGEDARDLMVALEWIALDQEWQGSAATESYDTGVDGTPHKQDQATYTVDGSSATNVRRWSLDLAWVLDEDIRTSQVTRTHGLKLKLEARLTLRQLLLANTDYRKHNYGSASGTNADADFYESASNAFTVVYDNGEAGADNRQVTIAVPKIHWTGDAEYTDLNPDGSEAVYLERTGVAIKASGSDLATITAITGDTSAYV